MFNSREVYKLIMRYEWLLLLLVAVSGCVLPGFPNVFGSDAVNIQEKTVENGVKDVIIVKDINTIPNNPLLPDQQLILSFILENQDTLKSSSAMVDLFDAPTVRDVNGNKLCNLYTGIAVGNECPTGERCVQNPSDCTGGGSGTACYSGIGICCRAASSACLPDQCGADECIILPGEEKPVTYVLRTPTESDIKGIKTDTKLSFKTTYRFESYLNYLVPAVNMEEVINRQRSGDRTDISVTKSHSSGPVQIDMELQGSPYLITGVDSLGSSTVNPESVLVFKIRNVGSGNLVNSKILAGDLKIEFPSQFEVVRKDDIENEKFTCIRGTDKTICENNRIVGGQPLGEIPLYKDESRSSIRFAVKLNQPLYQPFQTYPITATVAYWYELRNSVDVTINPFQNV